MDKWADYAIVAVRYNPERTRIIIVKRRTDTGDKLENMTIETRTEIAASLHRKETYVTAYPKDDKWAKGAKVVLVNRDGTDFIQTVGNDEKQDNLGELPEF